MNTRLARRGIVALAGLCLVGLLQAPAMAQAPANDLIRNATAIEAVPFSVQQDAREAQRDGPRGCGNRGSVFFKFRPQTTVDLQADTFGSRYDTVLTVFRGPMGDLERVACNHDRADENHYTSAVRFEALAGVRYIFMVSDCCGSRRWDGHLEFTLTEVPTAPLEADVEITAATVDPVSGDIDVTGTATCNQRAFISLEGLIRQLRGDVFVARGYFFDHFLCTGVSDWGDTVSPEGDIAFAPGNARIRYRLYADSGFGFVAPGEVVEVVTLS